MVEYACQWGAACDISIVDLQSQKPQVMQILCLLLTD